MLWKGIIMLLHIDTAVLRSAVSVAEQTNSSISDAASLLNQITEYNTQQGPCLIAVKVKGGIKT